MNNSKLILSPYVQEINRGDKYIFINPNIPRWIVTDELGKLILSLFNGENTYDEIISTAVEGFGDIQKDLESLGNEIGVQVKAQKQAIFDEMHRI